MNRSPVAKLVVAGFVLAAIAAPSGAAPATSVKGVTVTATPDVANELARYRVKFSTGPGGLLGGDRITIRLAAGMLAAAGCDAVDEFSGNVTVNERVTSVSSISSCRRLKVRVPRGTLLGRNRKVTVVLGSSEEVLTNPGPGLHEITVRTTRDAAGAKSTKFEIKAASVADDGGTPTVSPATEVAIDLCAKEGTADIGPITVPIWGFAIMSGPDCTDEVPQLPGPVLGVDTATITAGDDVTVTLHNEVAGQDVPLEFVGQSLIPDTTGAPPAGTATYEFTAAEPGTYLYESGNNRQVLMGLYGALIVQSGTAGQAYDTPDSAYDTDAVLVLSEVDPGFNDDPSGFDLVEFAPTYWLINGKAYEDGDGAAASAAPSERVLLRFVNAGGLHHTMALLGTHQEVVARDAYPVTFPYQVVAETIPAGSTLDAIATIPGSAAPGTEFWLYNSQMHLDNAGSFPGGMLTFLEAAGP